MLRTRWKTFTLLLSMLIPNAAIAQTLPTSQPNMITIVREEVKLGRDADHAKVEAGWPAAYEKAKSPDYYLAMISMTGTPEAWYVTPYASHAAIGDTLKREDGDAIFAQSGDAPGVGLPVLQQQRAQALQSVVGDPRFGIAVLAQDFLDRARSTR